MELRAATPGSMETTNEQLRVQARNAETWLFERSVSRRAILREVQGLLEAMPAGKRLLVSGGFNPVATQLVGSPSTWERMVLPPAHPSPLANLLQAGRVLPADGKLDLPDESVDVVVLLDVLQHVAQDRALLEECHRVLKPTGRLILEVPYAKRWSVVGALQAVLGLSRHRPQQPRRGYSESMMFDLIKDGFDAEELHTFSRAFVGLAETWAEFVASLMGSRRDFESENLNQELRALDNLRKAFAWLYPFAALGAGLDRLISFTKGSRLIGRFRRRPWKPRRSPTLRDGRSIAEATINTRIGTAAPF